MEASASRLLVTALLVSLAGVLLAMIGSAAATKKFDIDNGSVRKPSQVFETMGIVKFGKVRGLVLLQL